MGLRIPQAAQDEINALKARVHTLEQENARLQAALSEAKTHAPASPIRLDARHIEIVPSEEKPHSAAVKTESRKPPIVCIMPSEESPHPRPSESASSVGSRQALLASSAALEACAVDPPAADVSSGSMEAASSAVSVASSPPALPPEARRFVGTWTQTAVENYDNFLKEVVGLNYVTRRIALRIKPQPTWSIDDATPAHEARLHCRVECFGAKPIDELYRGGACMHASSSSTPHTHMVTAGYMGLEAGRRAWRSPLYAGLTRHRHAMHAMHAASCRAWQVWRRRRRRIPTSQA